MRIFSQEAQKLIAGSGELSDAARKEVETLSNPSSSPAAQVGAMKALIGMGHSRLAQVMQDARRVRHDASLDLDSSKLLAPEALDAHKWLTNRLAHGPGTADRGAGGTAPAPGGAAPAGAPRKYNPATGAIE
jgi:hypothetical protein